MMAVKYFAFLLLLINMIGNFYDFKWSVYILVQSLHDKSNTE